ncbi:hypothetical protein [Streptosporangium sp. NPDC020145]|uniref:hypothetical protein n=1 Tax=Streptosporangium sp. NPDC020145 TaxID=3154694 RepID=UPI003435C31C
MGRELSEREAADLIASGEMVEVRHDPDWLAQGMAALRERRERYAAEWESGQMVDYQAVAARRDRLRSVKTEYRRRRRSN